MHLDTFTRSYIEAALWTTTDNSRPDGGDPLDQNYGIEDIHPDTLTKMVAICRIFQDAHADDIEGNSDLAGYHFWLTRNGHGSGFWNGDWPDEVGERLTEAAHLYHETDLYVGDDGFIHETRA